MSPPRVPSADRALPSPEALARAINEFLSRHPDASVVEDGKVAFELRATQVRVSADHGRCTVHLWSGERSLVRTVLDAEALAGGALRLTTQRMGQSQTRRMDLTPASEAGPARRTATARDKQRSEYQRTLERLLPRFFPALRAEGLRTAMDLERSFGPAYVRGSLVEGPRAWALVAVGELESQAMVEGVLTVGVLWLDHCRNHGDGRVRYEGLKVIVPRGQAMLTAARMAWLDERKAAWELWELDRAHEELVQRDLDDQGNMRMALVHRPDERAAQERFAAAVRAVMELVPEGEHARVEQHLRSSAELAFLLHGLEFARARIQPAATGFSHAVEVTVGVGPSETPLQEGTREELRELVADLFARRRAAVPVLDFGARRGQMSGRIGSATKTEAAHARMNLGVAAGKRRLPASQDPLYRAAPERWLESMLRADLSPLTRGLAPLPASTPSLRAVAGRVLRAMEIEEMEEDDGVGNRAEPANAGARWASARAGSRSSVLPRLNPRHLYSQVAAIAGTKDKGLLDLLGVTDDGRLAVIEIKADDDMHFALQGLDYWVRVRQQHAAAPDAATGLGEFQRHGYFRELELSPLEPRLYLVAPALHVHPATEVMLKYLSPRVPWELLAVDERWRHKVRVVWRRSGGMGA